MRMAQRLPRLFFFFFNDTATTEIYTLSLHDALPIWSVVGEKIARLTRRSAERRVPLVIVSASGGARKQEGVLSLMQLAKSSVEIARLRAPRVPVISIFPDPTQGGAAVPV